MPSTRPQAAFEAISPNLDIRQLVETTPTFQWATRIHCDMIDYHGMEQFEQLVLLHVIIGGQPLVIEGYETRLDKWTYAVQWLRDNWGTKVVDARDLTAGKNVPMTVQHYLKHMALLTNQWDKNNYKDKDRQRMYLKDIDCPPIWEDKLRDQLPLGIFYMNESTGDVGGFGAIDEVDPNGPGVRKGRGVARAGDLMSSLPKEMRAENLMCYIGHEGTYTPAHREMCASLGQNIMVEASTATIEEGKLTKPGSSLWFMTESKEREVVSEYWLSRLGHDIEVEKHFAQINAWKHAPFKVHVVEQKLGDLILIPPLAPHQVWNRGTRTVKVAWNRTTVETLEMAMEEALPKARMVCRDEQYKNKAIVYYTLQRYSKALHLADRHRKTGMVQSNTDIKARQLLKDFKRLQALFTKIMLSESFAIDKQEKNVERLDYDSNITCSYCRCNIFNRFLTCPSCVGKLPNGDLDTYDICLDCYAMGRSCLCISKLRWAEQWDWHDLHNKHDSWRRQIIDLEGVVNEKSPRSLKSELLLLGGQRTLAQICQVELGRRPFHDIKKDTAIAEGKDQDVAREEIDEVDANGNVRRKKKVRRSEKYVREHGRCHVDCYWEPRWKQAQCSKCDKNYCYGNLFRAYDMMPQEIMADPHWMCPSCRKICACRQCRHRPGFKQYTPKGTLLGHNTKAVADVRSVESLVDFSHPNIAWIQKAGDDHAEDTLRLRRRLRQAEVAKASDPRLSEDYVGGEDENIDARIMQLAQQEGIPIDPALGAMNAGSTPQSNEDEDVIVEHPEEPQYGYDPALEDGPPSQSFVPDGGVLWETEHAYEPTDAITYVYPDLAAPPQMPPAPVEGYTPALIPGYEPAMPLEAHDQIEMIERKRKRAAVDEGDRPYVYKKSLPKSKVRKSLVVKLAMNKARLARLVENFEVAQEVAQEAAAPVVSSDLQALNLDTQDAGLQTVQNPRQDVEAPLQDQDDEFTPVRYRSRRKPRPNGESRPDPDADITRRTTRKQAVTYAEPDDDEEFNDMVVVPKPADSKLATMENANRVASIMDVDDVPAEISANEDADQLTNSGLATIRASDKLHLADPALASSILYSIPQVDKAAGSSNPPTIVHAQLSAPSRPSTSSSSSSSQVPAKIMAEAQANKKAKMAAIEGDSDVSDADSIPCESEQSQQPSSQQSLSPPRQSTHKSSFGSKAPRLSLPSTTVFRSTPPVVRLPDRPLTVQKASAADWVDSSSDEDNLSVSRTVNHKPTSGFMTVNGRHHPASTRGQGPAKRRGRPPKTR